MNTDDSEVSPVPLETDDPRVRFDLLVPQVTNGAELLQFHAVDAWIKDLSTRRKDENARLLALEKLWEVRKSELEVQLKSLLLKAQADGSKTLQTILATTFTKDRKDSVEWENESDVVFWFLEQPLELLEEVHDYRVRYALTPEGKAKVREALLGCAKAGLDLPPGVVITPAGKTVVTRRLLSQRLTPRQILAQRGEHLDRLNGAGPSEET